MIRQFWHALGLLLLTGCSTQKISDIAYTEPMKSSVKAPMLNLFLPKRPTAEKQPVLIFIHGGNWNSGNKDIYGLMGRNFARKGVVTVIPDYTPSPKANYGQMASQVAQTIQWTLAHIEDYGGDVSQLYISGHSAGGHLAALAVMDPRYGIDPETIAGIILNDAAGLDMAHYLGYNPPTDRFDYRATWSDDPEVWRKASPIYYIGSDTPPIMVYWGKKTYASIIEGNDRFLKVLHTFQPDARPIILNKSHIPMVLQYFRGRSERFDEILAFIAHNRP